MTKPAKDLSVNPLANTEPDQIGELEKKCQEYLQGWQRARADYDNLKKDTQKLITELKGVVETELIMDVLPIYDHFKLALSHLPAEQSKSDWWEGINHIKREFEDFLKKFSISEIKTVGESFDHQLHEAVGEEVSDQPAGIIIKEVSPGYQKPDQVLRPAKVVISKKINN